MMKSKTILLVAFIFAASYTYSQTIEAGKSIAKKNKLTFLNAYNFDFNNTGKSGYLGHLSAFFPLDRSTGVYYINAGLLKANYSSLGSMQTFTEQVDNVKINPLDVVGVGDEFKKQFNEYKEEFKITSYSAYIQPMVRVLGDDKSRLFLHGHIEFVVYDAENVVNVNTVQSETLTATADDVAAGFQNRVMSNSYKNSFYGFYAGPGLTGDFTIDDTTDYKLHFAFQGTVGICNVQPGNGISSVGNINVDNGNKDLAGNLSGDQHLFHLIHSYFTNEFNGLNLSVGTQIRGTFKNPALYVFYIGVNTDLAKIAGLFKDDSANN